MQMCECIIIAEDKQNQTAAWPDLNDLNSSQGEIVGTCILENGTTGGNAAFGFRIKVPGQKREIIVMATEGMVRNFHKSLEIATEGFKRRKKNMMGKN